MTEIYDADRQYLVEINKAAEELEQAINSARKYGLVVNVSIEEITSSSTYSLSKTNLYVRVYREIKND